MGHSYVSKSESSLKSLNLSKIKIKSISFLNWLFDSCVSIEFLNLSYFNFDYFNIDLYKEFNDNFRTCVNLKKIDISNGYTTNYTRTYKLFNNFRLISVDFSNFNTSSVINMEGMFNYCEGLISLNLSNFNTSSVINMGGMFN